MTQPSDSFIERFAVEVRYYRTLMAEAYDGVINEGVSKYPVFVFHKQDITVGLPIADRHVIKEDWSVNVSTLEEFYIKGLVTIEKIEQIKTRVAGTHPQYCCLVLGEDKGSIIFIPRE
ncbi:MAG: hypothetical protein ABJC12_03280 [Saprospiraceae bacterium]